MSKKNGVSWIFRAESEAKAEQKKALLIPNVAFSPENFFLIFEQTELTFMVFEAKTDKLVYVSDSYRHIWGKDPQNLYKSPNSWLFQIHSEDYFQASSTIRTKLRADREFVEQFRIVRSDGTCCPVRVKAFPLYDRAMCATYYMALFTNLSEQASLKQTCQDEVGKYNYFFNLTTTAFAVTSDRGDFMAVNDAFAKLLGYSRTELLSLSWSDIGYAENSRDYLVNIQDLISGTKTFVQVNKSCLTKERQVIQIVLKITIGRSHDGQQSWFNNEILDIRERKYIEENLILGHSHDLITYLPNHANFTEILSEEIKRSRSDTNYHYAVLMLSIERLKNVVNSVGQAIANEILRLIAVRLENLLQGSDFLARLEGENFGIILRHIQNLSNIQAVAQRLNKALRESFQVEGRELFISVSIAVIADTTYYKKVDHILRDANLTIQHLKKDELTSIEVFNPGIRKIAQSRLEISCAMPKALENQEFEVYYQPIVCLQTNQIYGFEALARWHHQGKFISPAEFIPISEENGLIIPLGIWLLEEACRQVVKWQQLNSQYQELKISVNLSPKQFFAVHLVSDVERILTGTGLKNSCLKLEITEGLFINDFQRVMNLFNHLGELGVQFSIDDFGTGYSCLSYLQSLPAHTLKLDRSFVTDIKQEKNYRIAQAIVTLAHELNMNIVAEGVEDEEQLALLRELKCEYGQGFYFAKPLSHQEIEKFLKVN